MPPEYLDIAGVAELLNVNPATVRAYIARQATTHFPEHDIKVGAHRGWRRSTIERWKQSRPGQGRRRYQQGGGHE